MADEFPQGQVPAEAAPAGVMPDGTSQFAQAAPQLTPQPLPKQKKKFNFFTLLLILAIIAAVGYFGYEYILGTKPEFSVSGTKFTMKSTPQDFLDAGLVICDKDGKIVDLTGKSVLGKTVPMNEYQIGIQTSSDRATGTGIYFKVMNTATNAKSMKNCMVYSVTYYPGQDKTGGKVKINGEDLTNLDADKWAESFKKVGFPFSDKDLDRYKSGSTTIILGERGQYKFEAHLETSSKKPSYILFKNGIKTETK
jgi:hypothetical protein